MQSECYQRSINHGGTFLAVPGANGTSIDGFKGEARKRGLPATGPTGPMEQREGICFLLKPANIRLVFSCRDLPNPHVMNAAPILFIFWMCDLASKMKTSTPTLILVSFSIARLAPNSGPPDRSVHELSMYSSDLDDVQIFADGARHSLTFSHPHRTQVSISQLSSAPFRASTGLKWQPNFPSIYTNRYIYILIYMHFTYFCKCLQYFAIISILKTE